MKLNTTSLTVCVCVRRAVCNNMSAFHNSFFIWFCTGHCSECCCVGRKSNNSGNCKHSF